MYRPPNGVCGVCGEEFNQQGGCRCNGYTFAKAAESPTTAPNSDYAAALNNLHGWFFAIEHKLTVHEASVFVKYMERLNPLRAADCA